MMRLYVNFLNVRSLRQTIKAFQVKDNNGRRLHKHFLQLVISKQC